MTGILDEVFDPVIREGHEDEEEMGQVEWLFATEDLEKLKRQLAEKIRKEIEPRCSCGCDRPGDIIKQLLGEQSE